MSFKYMFLWTASLLFFSDCSSSEPSSYINSVTIKQSEGVGPVVLVIEIISTETNLNSALEKGDFELSFSTLFSQLDNETRQVYKVEQNKYHLIITTTLWADLSEEDFNTKRKNMISLLQLKIKILNGSIWELNPKD